MNDLGREIIAALGARGETIATAESITGGELAVALTTSAGASHVFKGGVVAYSKESKVRELSVPISLIEEHSVYSEQVAIAMAAGARERFETDWAISTTGVAGPGPSHGVSSGQVWIAIAGAKSSEAFKMELAGSRTEVRAGAVSGALAGFARILGR